MIQNLQSTIKIKIIPIKNTYEISYNIKAKKICISIHCRTTHNLNTISLFGPSAGNLNFLFKNYKEAKIIKCGLKSF